MGWKKGCLLAAGVGLVLVALGAGVVFYATSGAVEAADEFLAALGEGDVEGAYGMTAAAFQERQSQAAFALVIEALGLDSYQSSTWTSRSVEGSRAELEGTFTNRGGDRLPLELTLVKSDDGWRVFSVAGEQAGAAVQRPGESGAVSPPPAAVPPAEELPRLASEAILALNRSILANDFSTFYAGISKLWQAQTTADEIATAFQVFVEREIDLSAIQQVEPVFEPAQLDSEGALRVSGYYPTTPVRVVFQLRFVHESDGWKLLGIQVDLKE